MVLYLEGESGLAVDIILNRQVVYTRNENFGVIKDHRLLRRLRRPLRGVYT